jgi:hypothetical protein
MFKSIKKFICNLFNIKACKCKDEHLEFYEETPKQKKMRLKYKKDFK